MRKFLIAGVFCLISAATSSIVVAETPVLLAQADAQATAKAEKEKKKAKNKRVCRYVRETGSRIRERVCRKQKDWDRLEEASRENVERAYEGSNRNTAGGDT